MEATKQNSAGTAFKIIFGGKRRVACRDEFSEIHGVTAYLGKYINT